MSKKVKLSLALGCLFVSGLGYVAGRYTTAQRHIDARSALTRSRNEIRQDLERAEDQLSSCRNRVARLDAHWHLRLALERTTDRSTARSHLTQAASDLERAAGRQGQLDELAKEIRAVSVPSTEGGASQGMNCAGPRWRREIEELAEELQAER